MLRGEKKGAAGEEGKKRWERWLNWTLLIRLIINLIIWMIRPEISEAFCLCRLHERVSPL